MPKRLLSVKIDTIIWLLFIVNAFIILGNLNGVIYGFVRIVAPLSPILLVNSLLLLYLLLIKYPVKGYRNYLFDIFMAFFVLHIYIGVMSGLYFYDEYVWDNNGGLFRAVRKLVPSVLIFLSSYLFFVYASKQGKLMKILNILIYLSIIAVLLIVFGSALGLSASIYEGMTISTSSRAAGLYSNPNGAGIAANTALSLVFGKLYIQKKQLLLCYSFILLSLYAAFLTFSKAAMIIAIFIVLGNFFIMAINFRNIRTFQRRRLMYFIVAVGITILYLSTVLGSYLEKLDLQQLQRIQYTMELVEGNINKNTTSERDIAWIMAYERIIKNPIFGYGLDSFHKIPGLGYGVHNTLLMIWGESGIFTLFLFVIFFILSTIRSLFIKNKGFLLIVFGLMCVYLLQDVLSSHNALENKVSIMMLALCIAIISQMRGSFTRQVMQNDNQ